MACSLCNYLVTRGIANHRKPLPGLPSVPLNHHVLVMSVSLCSHHFPYLLQAFKYYFKVVDYQFQNTKTFFQIFYKTPSNSKCKFINVISKSAFLSKLSSSSKANTLPYITIRNIRILFYFLLSCTCPII